MIAALLNKKRDRALAEIGGDAGKIKVEIATGFAGLEKKAEALKLVLNTGDQKYYAPWEIQAKRPDWPIRDFILSQRKPQSVAEIVEGVEHETDADTIQAVLDKDQKNASRKMFSQVGDKWWVAGKPLPKK